MKVFQAKIFLLIGLEVRMNCWIGKNTWEDQQWAAVCQELAKKQELLAESAPENALVDFSWEDNGLKDLESRLEEVRKDYLLPLCCGVSDNIEEDYALAIDKLYEAGLQEYLDILQEQIDNYWEDRS